MSGSASARAPYRSDALVREERRPRGQGADAEAAAGIVADAAQLPDATEIHEPLRTREPQLHERDEALAAREDADRRIGTRHQVECLLERGGPGVLERRRDHALPAGPGRRFEVAITSAAPSAARASVHERGAPPRITDAPSRIEVTIDW